MSDSPIERDLSAQIANSVLYEDSAARVWLLELKPGEATSWHRHDHDYIYVVTAATPVQTELIDGTIERQDDQVGATSYRRPDAGHRLVNTGDTVYRNIVVELLKPER